MSRTIRAYLAVAAVAFALIGVNAMLHPAAAVAGIGLGADGVAGLNEIRASYGGLQLAIALVAATGLVWRPARLPALAVSTVLCTGMALGRLVSLAVDGLPPAPMLLWLSLELLATIIGAALLLRNRHLAPVQPHSTPNLGTGETTSPN
ncbi:DUF4345 family protein [Rhodococcus sp. ACT016]|uniref:DUF4345 family protein n=1 Tax=Rhodococcus sp. ACT016 TaxID=3134808 RepID=UPI003D26DD95